MKNKWNRRLLFLLMSLMFAVSPALNAEEVTLQNPGFEEGERGWAINNEMDQGMTQILAEAAHSGSYGLRITDDNSSGAGRAAQGRIQAQANATYCLSFWTRNHSGAALAVMLVFQDEKGNWLTSITPETMIRYVVPENQHEWKKAELTAKAPTGTKRAEIIISSWKEGKSVTDVDDFELTKID